MTTRAIEEDVEVGEVTPEEGRKGGSRTVVVESNVSRGIEEGESFYSAGTNGVEDGRTPTLFIPNDKDV